MAPFPTYTPHLPGDRAGTLGALELPQHRWPWGRAEKPCLPLPMLFFFPNTPTVNNAYCQPFCRLLLYNLAARADARRMDISGSPLTPHLFQNLRRLLWTRCSAFRCTDGFLARHNDIPLRSALFVHLQFCTRGSLPRDVPPSAATVRKAATLHTATQRRFIRRITTASLRWLLRRSASAFFPAALL